MQEHDKNVHFYFSNFDPVTYSHSNPSKKDDNNSIIIGDRIELHRYADCQKWINENKFPLDFFTKNYNLIQTFYQHLRPSLQEIYINLEDVWITHGSENKNNIAIKQNLPFECHKNNYPEFYWFAEDNLKFQDQKSLEAGKRLCPEYSKYVSVNIDFLPLENCHIHTFLSDCPHWDFHQSFPSKNYCVGMISKNKLLKTGNDLVPAPPTTVGRDHPFMVIKNPIPTTEWIFIYDTDESLEVISFEKNKLIKYKTVNDFYKTIKILMSRIECLKVT